MTPSRMQIFLDNIEDMPNLSNLKYVTLAGEALPLNLRDVLKKLGVKKIYNGYGPSETTVFSSFTDVTESNEITIGVPIANTQNYILDKNLKLVPIGVAGELYISGDGVGKGYLNRQDLTQERYIDNPFIDGSIMYKTGDVCKYDNNGEIYYLGRADNQVKVRDATTRYGSCMPSKKNLYFSSRLIMLPDDKVDAIIVHELCHMKYKYHDKQFYDLVATYIPNYKEIDKWLKQYGKIIMF